MALLENSLPTIFLHEGRYVDNKNDPGGPTIYGWSFRTLKKLGDLDHDGWLDGDIDHDGDVDIEDIKKLDVPQAIKLYDMYFWTKYGYAKILNQNIATKTFDLCINMGSVASHKCAQRAVRAASGLILVEDGILGSKTLEAINNADPLKLLPAFKSEAAGYYRSIRYTGSSDSLNGWLNRAYSDAI